jgi:carbon starvation protein
MLLEGLVAVLALATVMMIPRGQEILKTDPNLIYANGIAKYLGLVGINFNVAFPFALLAFSTFVYDTLDVCTRLARYIFQELTGWRTQIGGFFATLITLILPLSFLLLGKEKGYVIAWPIFGISNQLLASLTLLAVSVWLIKSGRNAFYALIPMVFMMLVTMSSLILEILSFVQNLFLIPAKPQILISGVCSIILLFLSVCLIIEAKKALKLKVNPVR